MSDAQKNTSMMSYESIADEVNLLNETTSSLRRMRMAFAKDFELLREYLANSQFNHSYPKIEKEINDIISWWHISDSVEVLKGELNGYFDKITYIDKEIDEIKLLQKTLLQYPDRHNRKNVTDKVEVFLQNINDISISQLDNMCVEVIPRIHIMADSVMHGFAQEKDKVGINKGDAQQLKKRIGGLGKYVDKFNLRQICIEGNRIAEQVIQSPNNAKPDVDAANLQKINQKLERCMAQFKAEDKQFDTLIQTLFDNKCSIWQEDYDGFLSILEKGAYQVETSASQLQAQYDVLIVTKEKEINQELSCFKEKILSFFSDEIRSLRKDVHKRQDLHNLVYSMKRKVAENKKKLILTILKYVGIAAAVVLLIVLVIKYWMWILGIGVVIGIAIYLFNK